MMAGRARTAAALGPARPVATGLPASKRRARFRPPRAPHLLGSSVG